MSKNLKWAADSQTKTIRDRGQEKTPSAASMRRDPVQTAGADIELPDRFASTKKLMGVLIHLPLEQVAEVQNWPATDTIPAGKPTQEEEDPPNGDSAGVYFVTVEEFESRKEKPK